MSLIGTDSNYGESTQMLLKKPQIKTFCHINQGEGEEAEFECFFNIFEFLQVISIYYVFVGRNNLYPTLFLLWQCPHAIRSFVIHPQVSGNLLSIYVLCVC